MRCAGGIELDDSIPLPSPVGDCFLADFEQPQEVVRMERLFASICVSNENKSTIQPQNGRLRNQFNHFVPSVNGKGTRKIQHCNPCESPRSAAPETGLRHAGFRDLIRSAVKSVNISVWRIFRDANATFRTIGAITAPICASHIQRSSLRAASESAARTCAPGWFSPLSPPRRISVTSKSIQGKYV